MTRADAVADVARFVGALLFAIGIGGAVLGGYAPIQKSAGLCGDPTLEIRDPENAAPPGAPPDDRPTFQASDLSSAERAAFVEAVNSPTNEAKIDGPIEHAALRNGAVVTYQGERHYAAIGSLNRCVSVDPLVFALGASLVVLGGVAYFGPSLWRRLGPLKES